MPAPFKSPKIGSPWKITNGKVEFRLPGEHSARLNLPDIEFEDQGRRKKREKGVWYLELWASGMERKPDCGWWKLDSILSTMSLDFRAEVLMGNPIPQVVADHQWLVHYNKFWPRNGYPSALIPSSRDENIWRDDGEYVLVGSEYVFKPHARKMLVVAKPKPAPAPILREDDDEEPDLFSQPKPRAVYVRED